MLVKLSDRSWFPKVPRNFAPLPGAVVTPMVELYSVNPIAGLGVVDHAERLGEAPWKVSE